MTKRTNSRIKWKRYKKLEENNKVFIKPFNWQNLKNYENRKRNLYLRRKNNNDSKCSSRLTLPHHIDFEDNIDGVESLILRIKEYLKLTSRDTKVNLSELSSISINGLVFLISEIDRIQNKKSISRFNIKKVFKYNSKFGLNPNNDKLKFLFNKIGYWDYFGIKNPYSITDEVKNDYFLTIKSDVLSKSQYVAELRKFIGAKVSFLKNEVVQDYFDDAITEAMANSVEHGYINKTEFRTKGKWWLCGHYDKINSSLEFSFRDYGVGLRKTLEYNSDDKVVSLLRSINNARKSDSNIIKMLVNDKLPKYKGKKDKLRGYGFKKFKEFAHNLEYDCEMKILSGTGKYKYIYNSSLDQGQEILFDNDFRIDGFIISWKIYLKGNM